MERIHKTPGVVFRPRFSKFNTEALNLPRVRCGGLDFRVDVVEEFFEVGDEHFDQLCGLGVTGVLVVPCAAQRTELQFLLGSVADFRMATTRSEFRTARFPRRLRDRLRHSPPDLSSKAL